MDAKQTFENMSVAKAVSLSTSVFLLFMAIGTLFGMGGSVGGGYFVSPFGCLAVPED